MIATLCIMTCALAAGQTPERGEWSLAPQLAPGLELVYSGSYTEEDLIPHVQFKRQYKLENTFLVLDGGPRNSEVAWMTNLRLVDRPGPAKESSTQPASVRLEVGRVSAQGAVQGRAGVSLNMSVSGPPGLDTSYLVHGPVGRVKRGETWEASEPGRPPRTWQVLGTEVRGNVTLLKVQGQQQSDDWDRPRADKVAWRRRDLVWIMPQLGLAYRVERTMERRDPARRDPTFRAVAQFELDSRLKYPGKLFDDRKLEIAQARKFLEDAEPLIKQPIGRKGQLEVLSKKVASHLESQAPTPFRKAIVHLQGRLEAARRGEVPAELAGDDAPVVVAQVALGQRVPDFVVTSLTAKESFRFQRALGRPSLVFFYNPATDTGQQVLRFAQTLQEKHGANLGVVAMAVTQDDALARKQHAEMRLTFPIHDGNGLHLTFGVDATPRLVVLDGDGHLRAAVTGWGLQIAQEISDEIGRWLPKQGP